MAKATLLVVVSDTHCGSTVGLCPPDFGMLDDGCWRLNPIQAWIWKHWVSFGERVRAYVKDRPYVLLVNGDAIEGVHHHTKQIVHADPGVHVAIAIECLKPLASRAERVYVTRGTPAHVGHSSEHAIGRALGAVEEDGMYSQYHQIFRVGKSLVSAKHHIGTSSRRALRGSALSINLEEERAECAAAGWPMPDVVIRSHRHTYGHYATEDADIIITPAWQCLTEYGWKVVPNAIPRVGGVVVDFAAASRPVVLPFVTTPPARVIK